MKLNNFIKIALLFAFFLAGQAGLAQIDLAKKLSGRILLQVESLGQAWYINPSDSKRYYLGRPTDAFNLMRQLGIGITNQDLSKLPVKEDNQTDTTFARNNAGKIFLQVQSKGECWYVNPVDLKRYYLGRPIDAFNLMRQMSLGIKEADINNIQIGYLSLSTATSSTTTPATDEVKQIVDGAAASIRSNKTSTAATYFTPEIKNLVEYTMSVLKDEGRLSLGNMMSATKLESSTDNEKIYSTEVYVGIVGRKVKVNFYLKKQSDGNWLIANL